MSLDGLTNLERLRRRAELQIAERDANTDDRTLHELHVHQAELEMQNQELLRIHDELEDALHNYADLYQSAPVAMFSVDRNLNVVEANAAAAALLGVTRVELIGASLATFAANPAALGQDLAAAFGGNKGAVPGAELCSPAGICHVCDLHIIVTEGDSPQARISVIDQTLSVARGRALEDRNALLRAVLDTASDGVFTMNATGLIRSVNGAGRRMFGYGPGALIGENLSVLLKPQDVPLVEGDGRDILARHQDGSTFPVELHVGQTTIAEETLLVAYLRDISEREAAKATLQQERDFLGELLHLAPVIIMVLDVDGRIEIVNAYFEATTGYSGDEVRGSIWFDTFVPHRDRDRMHAVHAETLATGGTEGVVNSVANRDGTERLLEWFNTTLPARDGGGAKVLAIGRDVTEERRLRDQFVQAQKMEVVGRMAGGIAHDFKNLLAGIKGVCGIAIKRASDSTGVVEAVRRINDAADRGAEMIEELLAISRRRPMDAVAVDLRERIQTSKLMYQRLLGAHVQLTVTFPAEPVYVLADPGQLDRVLLNLLVNARDAIRGGGEVALDLTVGEDLAGEYVTLSVCDTGAGMDEETRRHIFEPFFTTKAEGAGTGLGLAMVLAAADQLGGTIAVTSSPGAGARFDIRLPRHLTAPAPRVEMRAALPRGTGVVLLVEDDELVRLGVELQLQNLGYLVLVADHPDRALELLDTHGDAVRIVLSDVRMPGMSGPELAVQIAERYPDLPVVFMSAVAGSIEVEVDGTPRRRPVLAKPFAETALAHHLNAALGS